MAYHILIDNKQQGPFEIATIDAMIRDGRIVAGTYIWTAGMADWAFADTVPEIAALLRAADEPPPIGAPVSGAGGDAPPAPVGAPSARLSFGRTFGDAARIAARRPIRFLLFVCVLFLLVLASVAPTVWVAATMPPPAAEAPAEPPAPEETQAAETAGGGDPAPGAEDAESAPAAPAGDGDAAAEPPAGETAAGEDAAAAEAPPPSPRGRLWLGLAASFALASVFFGGLCVAMLELARGRAAGAGLLFAGVPRALPLLVFAVLASIAVAAGAVAFVLPGIFLFVCLALGPMILMDRHIGPFDAFVESYRAVMSLGWLRCFGVFLVFAAVAAALCAGAAAALCGLPGESAGFALAPDGWSGLAGPRAAFDAGVVVAALRESPGAGLAAAAIAAIAAAFATGALASMYEQGRPALERDRARRGEDRGANP